MPAYKDRMCECGKESHLLRKYGITMKQKQKMVVAQNGKCAICKKELGVGANTCVDHDHKTGEIRGILCNKCNSAIGFLDDDLVILERAARYLRDTT